MLRKWKLSSLMLLLALMMFVIASASTEENVTLPEMMTVVDEQAFENAVSITVLNIPESVEEIRSKAFAGCKRLESVTILAREVVIAPDAFDGCAPKFYVYPGSTAEVYALARGYEYELLEEGDAFLTKLFDMADETPDPSGFMGETFASHRLLVVMNGKRLPDVAVYEPINIITDGDGFFALQFENLEQTEACFDYLDAHRQAGTGGVLSVEPDAEIHAKLGLEDEDVTAASLDSVWKDSDPMGLQVYSEYIQRNYPGASATVVVLDSGVGMHPAINSYIISADDFTGTNSPRLDVNEHGTAVAGCIVDSVYGANVKIRSIKVAIKDDSNVIYKMNLVPAVKKAISYSPNVINISAAFDRIEAVEHYLKNAGCPVVVAAGNSNTSCDTLFPAGISAGNMITVSALDASYRKSNASNYGESVDYCAPGENIITYKPESSGTQPLPASGTSLAAPQISAAIALVSMDPNHSVSEMKDICSTLGAFIATESNPRHNHYGYGMPVLSMWADVVQGIEIVRDVPAVIDIGSTVVLKYQIVPESAADKTVTVTCSNPEVLDVVVNNGTLSITAMQKGEASITLIANGGAGVSITTGNISVVQPVKSIKITSVDGTNEVNMASSVNTLALKAFVQPNGASNQKVIWTSSDEKIAEVAPNGVVTPKAVGTVTIRAEAEDGYGAFAEFEVVVIDQLMPEDIFILFDDDDGYLNVGDKLQLNVEVVPEGAVASVTWKSFNEDVVTIDDSGVMTAVASGEASFIAMSAKMAGITSDPKVIHVVQPVKAVTVTAAGNKSDLDVGQTLQMTASVQPANADNTTVTWKSDNPAVAMIEANSGLVSAVAPGTTTVYAVSNAAGNKQSDKYTITVHQPPISISLTDADHVYVGETLQLTATVMPANAEGQELVWESSNTAVATVGNTGLVSGLTTGQVTIKVKSKAFPEVSNSVTLQVYPQWSYSGWVPISDVPADGIVTEQKWTYTELTSSTMADLDGWTLVSTDWKQTGSGNVKRAEFGSRAPYFLQTNSLYKKYNNAAPVNEETATTKRVVTKGSSPVTYIYWHWMYSTDPANGFTNRSIYFKDATGSSSATGNNYVYKHFEAFESTTNYTTTAVGNWNQNDDYYQWYRVDKSGYRSGWFYKLPVYQYDYVDYIIQYNYKRDLTVYTEPAASSTITNIQGYAKYKQANTTGVALSTWVTEDLVPEGATIAQQKWIYTETTTSNSASLENWTQVSSEWVESASGSVQRAEFSSRAPYFATSNSLYTKYNNAAPVNAETATSKRVVTKGTSPVTYIYWHWMYSVSAANGFVDRSIFYKSGYGSNASTGNEFNYKNFEAFESTTNYTTKAIGNWNQNDDYYQWYQVDKKGYRSGWFYKLPVYQYSYVDYSKLYTYSRQMESSTEPAQQANREDLRKLVRYILE